MPIADLRATRGKVFGYSGGESFARFFLPRGRAEFFNY